MPQDEIHVNLVSKLPKDKQTEIAKSITETYRIDLQSRSEWEEKRNRWYKLWLMVREPKNDPWENCSNVCLPLLAMAANQFHSRSYQSIFAPPGMVKVMPVSQNDMKRAMSVEKFLNWQTLYEMEEYEEVFDKLLQILPINGTHFKKIMWDTDLVRPKTQHISPLDVVLPYNTKDLETVRRITHRLYLYYDDLLDRKERGLYENIDSIKEEPEITDDSPTQETQDEATGQEKGPEDDNPHLILERHMNYDLGDGRKPYIFTVHYDSDKLLRVTSRQYKEAATTKTLNYFIDYHFIPNPEGFYSFGFGHFLENLNEMANTAFNQIFDGGTISNMMFGFYGRRAGFKKRKEKLKMMKMIEVEDASQIMFPKIPRLDTVLFQILGTIQQYVEQFTSTSDYLSGRESKGTKTPTAHGTLAIIEQGLVTFAVMTKRIFRSLRKELRLMMVLNQLFMPDTKEYRLMENEAEIAFRDVKKEDFSGIMDVIPIGDPSYASKLTRRQESQELYSILMQNPLIIGGPEGEPKPNMRAIHELTSDLIDAYDKKNKNKILPELPDEPDSPAVENAKFMQGDYVQPKPGEDHKAHLQVHGQFLQTEYFQVMPDEYKELVAGHIQATQVIMYQDQMQAAQLGAG